MVGVCYDDEMKRYLLLVGSMGCGPLPSDPEDEESGTPDTGFELQILEPGFEADIEQGWVCRGWGQIGPPATGADFPPVLYGGLDATERFRVQVQSLQAETTYTETVDPGGDYFFVYTGASLIVDESEDKCDDVIVNAYQRLDYVYTAIQGTSRVVEDGDGIGLEVEGIVLRADGTLLGDYGASGWEDLPDIVVADGTLPSLPVTE